MNISIGVLKQYIFECAIELVHGHEGLSREEIADRLLWILYEMDMMEEDENG